MFAAYISRGQSKPWLIFFSYKRPYCPTAALNFHLFLPTKSSLLFSITRSSSFSVIDVSVNIKNNVEKDTTLLLFFLSKSPGGHAISFQIKPWVAFRLPYLLIELFYIGMPVVRTDSRAVGRSVYSHVITKFSRMGSLYTPFSYPWCSAARASGARAPLLYFTLHHRCKQLLDHCTTLKHTYILKN